MTLTHNTMGHTNDRAPTCQIRLYVTGDELFLVPLVVHDARDTRYPSG